LGLPAFLEYLKLAIHDVFAGRAVRNHADRNTEVLFGKLDVMTCVLREILELLDAADVAFPTRELLENRLAALELRSGREVIDLLAVELVADADRNLIEIAECIKYGHGNAGCALHLASIAGCNEVEPADTTRTAGGSTVLALIAAALSQFFRFIAENLGNELACADSAGIRLNDRVNLFDLIRRDAACADSAEAGDRGGRR